MPPESNAEQVEYWNQQGHKWVRLQQLLDAMIGPLGERGLDAAGVASGERVLDVGCGCGGTTLAIARRSAPEGRVLGVDISRPMLSRARERVREEGLENVDFHEADAQVHGFEAEAFDLVFSRFGVMFFSEPEAAFANLRRALAPGGRLAFVCWQPVTQNQWMLVPLLAAAKHVPLPPPPAPEEPGPFSLGDPARVERILRGAGFVELEVAPMEGTLAIGGGGDLEESVRFALELGPTGRLLADAEPEAREAVAGAVREALAPFATPEGVRLPYAAWVATASRPKAGEQ
jgi:SAM-dependent methyltransferase